MIRTDYTWFRYLPLVCLLFALFIFLYFDLSHYLTFKEIRQNHIFLRAWANKHYWQMVGLFVIANATIVAISIPAASIMTILSGYLFGFWTGALYAVFAATLGAVILLAVVQLALHEIISEKSGTLFIKFKKGFRKNAFQYLLFLRLVPLFPFFIVNLVASILLVPFRAFTVATFLGCIPAALIYASAGNALGFFFNQNTLPDLTFIYQPEVLFPIIGVSLLTLLPIIYRQARPKHIPSIE